MSGEWMHFGGAVLGGVGHRDPDGRAHPGSDLFDFQDSHRDEYGIGVLAQEAFHSKPLGLDHQPPESQLGVYLGHFCHLARPFSWDSTAAPDLQQIGRAGCRRPRAQPVPSPVWQVRERDLIIKSATILDKHGQMRIMSHAARATRPLIV